MYANQDKSASGTAQIGRPQTALESESDGLNAALNSLGVTADVLVQRLASSVLRPEVVVQLANAGGVVRPSELAPPRAPMCNAAERLIEQRQRVDNITAQLQQALDRLEA